MNRGNQADELTAQLREALDRQPRVSLGFFPTPLHRLKRYGAIWRHSEFFIKRDDMTGLAMGGNKTRSLEFLLGEAVEREAEVVLTAGGLQSNLCRLTAAACARLGLDCILVHNNDEPRLLQGNMLLNELAGAESRYIGTVSEQERTRKLNSFAAQLREEGKRPFVIHNGASTPLGALGFTAGALELFEQQQCREVELKHIGMVGAMGGTAAGFIVGTALLGGPFHVHVISVEYSAPQLRMLLEELVEGALELLGLEPAVPVESVMTVYDEFLGPGYAVPTAASLLAQQELARLEGIFLELVYTSKTLAGISDLVNRGVVPRTEGVCYWHTGGEPALFAQAEQLQEE